VVRQEAFRNALVEAIKLYLVPPLRFYD